MHDYCDANEYLLQVVPQGTLSEDAYTDLMNAVSDEVDRRLAAEALELDTGERCSSCGRLTRFSGGHHIHLDDRTHQCEPCEVCMYCPRCHQELEYTGDFDGRLPSSGVKDGHEGFGRTYQDDNGHWFVFIQGRMVAPEHILTVVERGTDR